MTKYWYLLFAFLKRKMSQMTVARLFYAVGVEWKWRTEKSIYASYIVEVGGILGHTKFFLC